MKAYKVVDTDGWSSGFLYRETLSLKYQINKVTRPKVGKIFVFKNLKSAKKFIKSLNQNGFFGFRIFSGKAENCKRMLYMSRFSNIEQMWAYWEGDELRRRTPYGTYGCDAFTPLKEIKV